MSRIVNFSIQENDTAMSTLQSPDADSDDGLFGSLCSGPSINDLCFFPNAIAIGLATKVNLVQLAECPHGFGASNDELMLCCRDSVSQEGSCVWAQMASADMLGYFCSILGHSYTDTALEKTYKSSTPGIISMRCALRIQSRRREALEVKD